MACDSAYISISTIHTFPSRRPVVPITTVVGSSSGG